MPLKIVRNDIVKMNVDIIVNTANSEPAVGSGCDLAIHQAAGFDELLSFRARNIGSVPEGEVFITPGFALDCKYIIHAVSPLFWDGTRGEEEKLRACYRKSLLLAKEKDAHSIAFPLISTGSFAYPLEEGMRIAMDEINAFLLSNDMLVYVVVFGQKATSLGSKLAPDLEEFIDQHYVDRKRETEYPGELQERSTSIWRQISERVRSIDFRRPRQSEAPRSNYSDRRTDYVSEYMRDEIDDTVDFPQALPTAFNDRVADQDSDDAFSEAATDQDSGSAFGEAATDQSSDYVFGEDFYEVHEDALNERLQHISDTFSEYLIYLIDTKGMSYPEVYKRALVDKKAFSKIKNNPDAHPKKITAMCLCIGARLNLDQTRDLLARAGYALSPCDKTDIIFTYFIKNKIYDMIELDIQLEAHGLPCLIS